MSVLLTGSIAAFLGARPISFVDGNYIVGLDPVTATVGTGSIAFEHGGELQLEYDLSTGVITPIALPNTTVNFLLP